MLLKRPAARVVLLDRDDRIFLVNAEDPLDPFKFLFVSEWYGFWTLTLEA